MKTKIKELNKSMRGLFADEFIHKGNIILVLKGTSLPISTKTSIRIRNKNIEHYEGGYMNHHCDPNTKILVIEDIKEGIVVAKKTYLKEKRSLLIMKRQNQDFLILSIVIVMED